VFHVKANGEDGDPTGGSGFMPSSSFGPTHHANTKASVPLTDCVFTQGYWKNHPDVWPISSVKLGNVIYSKAQLLLIFDTPAAGNGLISLAHQLIAAKLNIAAGAIAPSLVLGAISTADALIGNKIVPPIGSGFLSPADDEPPHGRHRGVQRRRGHGQHPLHLDADQVAHLGRAQVSLSLAAAYARTFTRAPTRAPSVFRATWACRACRVRRRNTRAACSSARRRPRAWSR
jgi:hypothetical protein